MVLHPLNRGRNPYNIFKNAFIVNAIRIFFAILLLIVLVIKYMLVNNLL